jgi:hypothetical protein
VPVVNKLVMSRVRCQGGRKSYLPALCLTIQFLSDAQISAQSLPVSEIVLITEISCEYMHNILLLGWLVIGRGMDLVLESRRLLADDREGHQKWSDRPWPASQYPRFFQRMRWSEMFFPCSSSP